jgi:hypothetical protein
MSASDSRAKLVQATKKLLADWARAREVWRDDNCVGFDKKYITPLEASIRAATQAMERIAGMIDKAQYDCRDNGTHST